MIKQILIIMILCTMLVTAYNPTEKLTELEKGKNITLRLQEYTRSYVRIKEGSTAQFSTYDEKNRILSYNTIIIKEITPEKTKLSLSVRGRKFEDVELKLGENYKVNFTDDKKIPFMFIKYDTLHYSDNPEEKSIILLFNVPQFQMKEIESPEPITTDNIYGVSQKKETFTPLRIVFLVLIIGIITALIIMFKKSEK